MSRDLLDHQCSINGYVKLNAYSGGEKNPRCVQVTTPKDYVQMTFSEARILFINMAKAIADLEDEYDKAPPWWEKILKERGVGGGNK